MKKLETIIYIVGPKRSWEFQARHVKRIFLFILLVILGLGGTIGYQEYDNLQALKKAVVKLDQENLKNEKTYDSGRSIFCSYVSQPLSILSPYCFHTRSMRFHTFPYFFHAFTILFPHFFSGIKVGIFHLFDDSLAN